MKTMLVIDDEDKWIEQVKTWFEPLGFQIVGARTGEDGIELAHRVQPDIIVLDLVLPGLQGEDVLDELAHNPATATIPIVVFSIKGSDSRRRWRIVREHLVPIVPRPPTATDTQAENPPRVGHAPKWHLKELEASVTQLLSQRERDVLLSTPVVIYACGHRLVIEPGTREIELDGQHKTLTPNEQVVLAALRSVQGQPLTAKEIVERCTRIVSDDAVREIIARLRRKIEPDRHHPCFIITVKGHGYKLARSEEPPTD